MASPSFSPSRKSKQVAVNVEQGGEKTPPCVELEDQRGTAAVRSGRSNAEDKVPDDKVPFLICISMTIAGLWCTCGLSCNCLNWTYDGPGYLSQAEVWIPTVLQDQPGTAAPSASEGPQAQGPNNTAAEQWIKTHGQHQEDHQKCGKLNCVTVYQILHCITLVLLVVFFISDMIFFLIYTKLDNEYLLDTASFICLNLQTFLIIIYMTFTRVKLLFKWVNPASHAMLYAVDTCKRRMALVQKRYKTSKKCYLRSFLIEFNIFFLLPILNLSLQIGFGSSEFLSNCVSGWQIATFVFKSLLYFYYGCFWYGVYANRVYLSCQLDDGLNTIRELTRPKKCNADGARRLIDRIYSEFHVVRYFTGWLMAFTLLTVTFHVICCALLSYCKLSMVVTSRDNALLSMIWIQNIMFLVVPTYAIGGINLESLWKKFRHVLIKCKVQHKTKFWNDVCGYVTQIDTLASFPLEWTALFPIAGTILAEIFVRRDNISLEYWSYLSNNCTDSVESNFTCLD